MHQIAITSSKNGHQVSGSDDVINEPSKSRLNDAGILPKSLGFNPENITKDIDLVILGMHAKFDNPELTKAMELGLKVLSFPEYVYENSKEKTRVVIAGSHGKTSITSMIMHCLKVNNIDFDYMVGSSVIGFDYSVRLSNAPIIIIEGDEYLASPINKEPKFIYYKAHLAILSGIEWDHINVFKTEEIYDNQFIKLVNSLEPQAKLFYYHQEKLEKIISGHRDDIHLIPYQEIPYEVTNEDFYALTNEGKTLLSVFGKHNMENVQAAKHICNELGIQDENFWKAIASFQGAGRRLELISEDKDKIIFKDFAHSPSKLKATIDAVKEKYKYRSVVACFEMHTYSTLNRDFLPQYRDTMNLADNAIVFIDKEVVEKKGDRIFSQEDIVSNFNRDDIHLITDLSKLKLTLDSFKDKKPVYLMMSSGTFGGIDLKSIGENTIIESKILEVEKTPFESKIVLTKLEAKEVEDFALILSLSYLFFIFPSIYFYFKNKDIRSDLYYNHVVNIFNFQLFSTFLLIVGLFFSTVFSLLFFLGIGYNIYHIYQAINHLNLFKTFQLPQGFMILFPRIDKS